MDSESQLQQRGDNFITNKELKMNNKLRLCAAKTTSSGYNRALATKQLLQD
jgi:hypothetical protein